MEVEVSQNEMDYDWAQILKMGNGLYTPENAEEYEQIKRGKGPCHCKETFNCDLCKEPIYYDAQAEKYKCNIESRFEKHIPICDVCKRPITYHEWDEEEAYS